MSFVAIQCIHEPTPGTKWQANFDRTWPHYRKWYLSEGSAARPGYLTCRDALGEHLPELTLVYRELCRLAGDGDAIARFLSLYNPPPFMSGCTQVAWTDNDPALIRNYDYNPRWFEGAMFHTEWLKPVIGVSDCTWGLLDGINASGLCASLTFGGRNVRGDGFGVTLILRYVLETCDTVEEAVNALRRIPIHMAYNILLVDKSGAFATAFLGPDRTPAILPNRVCSNHQETIDWPEYAERTATAQREAALHRYLADPGMTRETLAAQFLNPPLRNTEFAKSFGTLYTAAYEPQTGSVTLSWPRRTLTQSFSAFDETHIVVKMSEPVSTKLSL